MSHLAFTGIARQHLGDLIEKLAKLWCALREAELHERRAQISRVGNNVNQIAYIYNAAGQPRPGELTHALTALKCTLARVDDAADALVKKRT